VAQAQSAGYCPYLLERGGTTTHDNKGSSVYALEQPAEYSSCRFEDGFLIKTVKLRGLSVDASPSADEVERFRAALFLKFGPSDSLSLSVA
jgi:hypothetical protein